MEKLIELLNEYQKELNYKEENKRNYEIYERELKDDNIRMNDLDDPYEGLNMYGGYAKARLISKQFGFIKRLVDNNKINKRKIDTRLVRYVENHYDEEGYWVESSYEDYSDTNTLLMLLSISDTPIEDLISYLK